MNPEYLSKMIPIMKSEYFVTPYAKQVFKMCKDFYNEYSTCPKKHIKDIWESEKLKIVGDDEGEIVDGVATFLQSISKEYENAEESNIDFLLDDINDYLDARIEDINNEKFSKAMDSEDVDEAKRILEKIINREKTISIDSKETYTFVDDIELTPPDWLLKGFMLKNSTNMIFGDPESAKTFAALDFGLSIASGIDYHTHQLCASGPVLYWAGEGFNTIKRRVSAWKIAHDVKERIPFILLNNNISLVDYKTLIPIETALKDINEKYGTPQLLIFDTWARALGEDENATKQANLAVKNLDKLRGLFGTSIFIVHHCGLNEKDRGRGSSAVNGAADNIYKCTKDANKIIRIISSKSKDFDNTEKMQFKLVDYDLGMKDEHKQSITSAALHMVNYEPIKKVRRYGKNEKLFLKLLTDLCIDEQSISIIKFREEIMGTGMRKDIYSQTLKKMVENNDIYRKDSLISPFSF